MTLWNTILEAVEAHRRHPDLQEAVLQAMFLFEKARISPARDAALGLAASMGWPDEIATEPVDLVARDRLVNSMRQLAEERPSDPSVGSIFWALGKVGDPSLIPFFREALKEQLNRNPGAVFQILVALDNLGEPVFGTSRSRSIDDVVENRKQAESYLAK